ncbi:MAG: hypothetical protein BWY58_00775 [Chloroflexi bacterium ADurb.Bin344]|nr:MAG: hypothetical protein BWY58_00775 [Chloroflexi bacterium ADurb.Bin344]
MIKTLFLLTRSKIAPENSDSNKVGMNWLAETRLTRNGLLVVVNASHGSAIFCIQVPILDMHMPTQ